MSKEHMRLFYFPTEDTSSASHLMCKMMTHTYRNDNCTVFFFQSTALDATVRPWLKRTQMQSKFEIQQYFYSEIPMLQVTNQKAVKKITCLISDQDGRNKRKNDS